MLKRPDFIKGLKFNPTPQDSQSAEALRAFGISFGLSPEGRVNALRITDARVSDNEIESIFGFAELQIVEIMIRSERSKMSEIGMKRLLALKSIRSFFVQAPKLISDSVTPEIGSSNLERLSLPYSDVTNDGVREIAKATGLSVLSLVGTKVSNAAIPYLCRLANLKELWLTKTNVNKQGLVELQKYIPQCKVFLTTSKRDQA